MTDRNDYGDEMADTQTTDELTDLLPSRRARGGILPPISHLLKQLQSLGDTLPEEAVVTRHLAMLMDEAALRPVADPVAWVSTGPLVPRRRLALGALVSGVMVNVLIGVLALVAVGASAAFAADGATPGDLFYGLDRAAERMGINDGGADERIEEAMALVERGQHHRAIEIIEEAIGNLADGAANANALDALHHASDHIATARAEGSSGYQATQVFRDQVAGLLSVIATEMEDGKVDGATIAETARGFSVTARQFAESRGDGQGAPFSDAPPGQSGLGLGSKPEIPPGQAKSPNAPGESNGP